MKFRVGVGSGRASLLFYTVFGLKVTYRLCVLVGTSDEKLVINYSFYEFYLKVILQFCLLI